MPGGYHGYWTSNFEKLNPNFGTEADLRSLIKTAHSKGMLVMVDVVANHMGPQYNPDGKTNFDLYYPFNKKEYYHKDCTVLDFEDRWMMENCWLYGLPDLNTEKKSVINYLNNWIKKLISDYEIDGIRIDTLRHVPVNFWKEFNEYAGVF